MITKIKSILAGIALVVAISLPITVPAIAHAAAATPPANGTADTSALCSGAAGNLGDVSTGQQDNTCAGGQSADTSINNTTSLIINLFSAVVGIIAVIMIIIGGVKYVTSGGSSEKTTSAKDTILFAIVGLVIVAIAQIIVKFVLHKAAAL